MTRPALAAIAAPLLVFLSLSFAASAAAAPPSHDAQEPQAGGERWRDPVEAVELPSSEWWRLSDGLARAAVLGAKGLEAFGQHRAAGEMYLAAGSVQPALEGVMRYRAARALLADEAPPVDRLAGLASTPGFPGPWRAAPLVEAQLAALLPDHTLTPELVRAALRDGATRQEACSWLGGELRVRERLEEAPTREAVQAQRPLLELEHGWCVGPQGQHTSLLQQLELEPTPGARLERAARLHEEVRFSSGLVELEALNLAELPDEAARCRATFLLARTTYRLRAQRKRAKDYYRQVIENCREVASASDDRLKSLYALGKWLYDTGSLDEARVYFEEILKDYPEQSHADDALFYLARIHRQKGEVDEELDRVEEALRRYPEGDMIHELVWESYEGLYKAGKFEHFLKVMETLQLPPRDDNYYSQGRLLYFRGQAARRTGRIDLAANLFATAWTRYPWSFYGYLSRLRLADLDPARAQKLSFEREADGALDGDWMFDASWSRTPAAVLAAAGAWGLAAEVEQERLEALGRPPHDNELWRLAFLTHRAGRYPVSHNIVRRRIGGRPWADPPRGRLIRWALAWPQPFRTAVREAVDAEAQQAGEASHVSLAFPQAIMREESSFVPDIESYAGALGLVQLMPATARGHDDDILGGVDEQKLREPATNLRVGVDHMHYLARRFGSHPALMAAAYNAGGGNLTKWLRNYPRDDIALFIEDIPYLQARDYTKRVIGSYGAYQFLSGAEDLDPVVGLSPVDF